MSDLLQTEPIQVGDEKSGFVCGEKALDRYFAKYALTNDQMGVGKTFVLRAQEVQDPGILGFYSLSMASIQSPNLGRLMQEKLPRYPMPVVLLGRLAVHQDAQGRGLGGFLLLDALERALNISESIGSIGMIVDAKNASAQSFYERYGFAELTQDWPKRMFLSFRTFLEAGDPSQ